MAGPGSDTLQTVPGGPPATTHRIALLPGDGIGGEVIPPAVALAEAAASRHGVTLGWKEYDWSCQHYARTGRMMPPDALDQLRDHDAILLGAVGAPGVPDHVSLWGLLIPIRRTFNQRINLRPIRRLPGIAGPLRSDEPIDLVVVRENVEGEYSEIGGRLYRGSADEIAVQESVFTRRGVEAVMRFAFELATTRRRELTSATKSNGIIHTMPFWDEIFEELAGDHSGIATRRVHIDALAAELVLKPQVHDVIVASNLFGDILSDLGAAVAGSLGTGPSANIDPSGEHPSMFEPIHGSAPDIAGQGIANPIATCWSAAMMLDHLGHTEAAASMITAIETVTEQGDPLTPDLGGTATTQAVGQALLDALH
jgi:tartrate dehydrogenase/decarboxylase/D-malate dehydrogenase